MSDAIDQTITRDEALRAGLKSYFTGVPCSQGHVARRATVNRTCLGCSGLKAKKLRAARGEIWNASRREKYAASPELRTRRAATNRQAREERGHLWNEVQRLRRLNDPEWREQQNAKRRGRDQRDQQLKTNYGITLERYNEILEAQGGVCAICGKKPSGTMHVDHCHSSLRVRGILCGKCNVGLGCYGDDPKILMRAVSYLETHFGSQ